MLIEKKNQRYLVNHVLIESLLSWVKENEIAIPEIQRPFVWDASKVRDLMDSLYKGYPIGYLISWKNPDARLKDGTVSQGKKVLIDGQQRVTALMAAILGQEIVNNDYKKGRITISFNPLDEVFEVKNSAIEKNGQWISDISKIITGDIDVFELVEQYCERNEGIERKVIYQKIESLRKITSRQIGYIELDADLEIDTVTEIFIRINSKGVVLSQADFAMSKIASSEQFNGSLLRKCIDYFCHLAVKPEFYENIKNFDADFVNSPFFSKISWLRAEKDDLYDPKHTDLLRVAFTHKFERGRLADLVNLLSGRNFETRTYENDIAAESFNKLEQGINSFINESNFKRFLMIIRSAGFVSSKMIRSQNTLNFAYILYLKLKEQGYEAHLIEKYVRRWFVLTILTGRYSGSPESWFDYDIKRISRMDFGEYLKMIEDSELAEGMWKVGLIQSLETSVSSSPYFNVFLASQVKANDKGFLSKEITVKDMIEYRGDIHHIFPSNYLKKNGLNRSQYNQIANYVLMQTEINIKVGDKAPNVYFAELKDQAANGGLKYGGISSYEQLQENLNMNCIPEEIFEMDINQYDDFLQLRRKLMAEKIFEYYFKL